MHNAGGESGWQAASRTLETDERDGAGVEGSSLEGTPAVVVHRAALTTVSFYAGEVPCMWLYTDFGVPVLTLYMKLL